MIKKLASKGFSKNCREVVIKVPEDHFLGLIAK
jgi:hypothetical protein